jgi:aminoglycoside N3'-acetyltransferase
LLNTIVQPAKKALRGPFRKIRASYVRLRYGFGPGDLLVFLRQSGINPGDAVFVHSSMEGFKGFRGTAAEIIQVFQEAVGSGGTLLMPTLSFAGTAIDYARQNRVFDPRTTPSQVGLLTELFRRSPAVIRSLHPTHSVAVWGKDQEWWTKDHPLAATPCGRGTPYARLLERDAKIVMAGLSIAPLTFFHFAEEVLAPQMPFDPFTTEHYTMRYRVNGEIFETAAMRLYNPAVSKRRNLAPLAAELRKAGYWREGKVGSLQAPVLGAKHIMQTLEEMARGSVFCYDAP